QLDPTWSYVVPVRILLQVQETRGPSLVQRSVFEQLRGHHFRAAVSAGKPGGVVIGQRHQNRFGTFSHALGRAPVPATGHGRSGRSHRGAEPLKVVLDSKSCRVTGGGE